MLRQLATLNSVLYCAIAAICFTSGPQTAVFGQEFIATAAEDHAHSAMPEFAPDWSLTDSASETVSASQYRGKPHVIIFYLGGDCLHCVEQLIAFAPHVEHFNEAGIDVLAVSAENIDSFRDSMATLETGFPFNRMLVDSDNRTFQEFRIFDHFKSSPQHGTCLVNSIGKIYWQHSSHEPFTDPALLLMVARKMIQEEEQVEAPKIFFDKSPKIVAYQLSRLDNERLLMVERAVDDTKYEPVYTAILTRAGMSPQHREEALAGLAAMHESNGVPQLICEIATIKTESKQDQQTSSELVDLLFRQPVDNLAMHSGRLIDGTTSSNSMLRAASLAALIASGRSEKAWQIVQESASNEDRARDWLNGIAFVPDMNQRAKEREKVIEFLAEDQPLQLRSAAISALGNINEAGNDTFQLVAAMMADDALRNAAVQTLLKTPDDDRDRETSRNLIDFLVNHAETTAPADRTTDEFTDAMQLADQLLKALPIDDARTFRGRLSEITVRVVRIQTVADEMRYDIPYFAVEAGRPVQLVLDNIDLMPHNLVVTKPGDLRLIANLGLQTGPAGGLEGKQYVPKHESVLFATNMVQSEAREALTFEVPLEPGEYPYVCTFPQHWSRMYGVMVVVKDLDEWLKDPVAPKDPTGNHRSFVQTWTVDNLTGELDSGTQGRTLAIGKKIFAEATCAQCHAVDGEGGTVGPELNDVFERLEGDRFAVLREILEPSHRIDEKYSMHKILTVDGELITGIITSEDDERIELIDNPDSKQPIIIPVDDIEEMIKTSTSIMPKALMDNFTKDEIFELYSYLEESQK